MSPDAPACAEVLLDLPARSADRRLTYWIPHPLRTSLRVGSRVLVPLGPRTARGFVIALVQCGADSNREIRDVLAAVDAYPLFTQRMLDLACRVADDTVSTLLEVVHCLAPAEVFRRRSVSLDRRPVAVLGPEALGAGRMGPRQAQILAALRAGGEVPVDELVGEGGRSALRRLIGRGAVLVKEPPVPAALDPTAAAQPRSPEPGRPAPVQPGGPTLLWGDAEARRAWIRERAAATVESGGRVLIIVPEIALVPRYVESLRPRLGNGVAPFHSGMTARERVGVWGRCLAQEVRAIVGTRSALFAPLDGVRLLIVDEEHDPAHKADAAPRYHARDVAFSRGALDGAHVVLGSATPSLETYAEVTAGRMGCVRLPPAAPHVEVTLVDLRAERAQGRHGLLTRPLISAIRRHLRSTGRVALFVNRAGYARVLACDECGFTVRCPHCEVTMPYDRNGRTVSCRICGRTSPAPGTCPRCRGVALRGIGPGTERVEEVMRRLFPGLRIARLDRETASQFNTIASEFASGRIRLIVGTQMLLRAFQIRPSLVGVLDADLLLHRPDFRAAERTWQQLRAVVALASGRPGPEAIVQTRVPDHPALAALVTGDDEAVYRGELEIRRDLGYPPYATLARVIASSPDREAAQRLAVGVAGLVQTRGVDVLGPAPARDPGSRVAFRYQCLLRAADASAVHAAARTALAGAPTKKGTRITVEMDPQEFH